MNAVQIKIRSFVELFLNMACFGLCLKAFLPYVQQRKQSGFVGSILFYIFTLTLYSILYFTDSLMFLLQITNLVPQDTQNNQWFFVFKSSSMNFIYLSGAELALDRFLLMCFSLQYTRWAISKRLCVIALLLCVMSIAFLLISKAFFPLYNAFYILGIMFDILVCVELFLHLLFCIKYHQFSRKQQQIQGSSSNQLKANQVALVQSISTVILCLIPKLLHRANMIFFGGKVFWIFMIAIYYQLFFSVNVLIISSFIVFRHSQREKMLIIPVTPSTSVPRSFAAKT
ncbi:hypothetical protein L596_008732 [Steinernema carpocapsae]|uniref:G-protein coupled receptors family 1 profile domain-containing protein n=1 Tax=Steinernema carpocapsae TaxID=34508 RepID=A0A4U5PDN6_STECR|nr:hypothetical protein L596_008732 [Steinernema carpocapsae]